MPIALRKAMIAPAASAIIGVYAAGAQGQVPRPVPAYPAPMLPNPLPANPALPNPLPANPGEPNPLPRTPEPAPGTLAYPSQGYVYPSPYSAPLGRRYLYYCPYYAQYYPYASLCPGGWVAVPGRRAAGSDWHWH
jgi:hypothetical protein